MTLVIVRSLCVISSLSLIRTRASANVLCAHGTCCEATPGLPPLIFWEKIILKDIKESRDVKESGGSSLKILGCLHCFWLGWGDGGSSPRVQLSMCLRCGPSYFAQHLGIFLPCSSLPAGCNITIESLLAYWERLWKA